MVDQSKKIYYFDHAASSWPKPPAVIAAMTESVLEYGANPGRGSHQLSMTASRVIFGARKNIAHLFQIQNPNDIFFFQNATSALNQAIKGFLKLGDHVITTSLEHNSVRRPLEYLREQQHIQITYISANREGKIDLKEIEKAINAHTKLIVCTHSSNLLGTILPVEEIAEIARRKRIKFLLDAAQTAGTYPIQVSSMAIDMLAFPGHKGLLGPQGIGGLYVNPAIELEPLIHGGTGSQSELIQQPTVRPDRYESGTMNTPGIAGLNAGIQHVTEQTVEVIHK
ncbi:MAG: cysteine desulfurase, partial [Paenibacillus sp. RIFOXYA1_FULL_44_5]